MRAEAQLRASFLDWTVSFLSPIPDDEETKLVKRLVCDAHAIFTQVIWDDGDLQGLFRRWFEVGREYEQEDSALTSIPASVDSQLKSIVAHQIETLFERIASDLEALCKLVWIWFQWGRSYQLGNAT